MMRVPFRQSRRTALTLAAVLASTLGSTASPLDAQAVRRGGDQSGFTTNSLAANDDGSTGLVDIGFMVNFGGESRSQLFVNNNGNVTFNTRLGQFTPTALTGATGRPIIAAFFADVDTRGTGSALTQYGMGMVDGRQAFGVNWDGVGYFSRHTDKLNIFQLILIDRSDIGAGDFDIEFNYDQMLWETGDASGGSNGFGGISAAVGYSQGSGVAGSFAQLAGSFEDGSLLDGGSNALVGNRFNSDLNGRYRFQVRGGVVVEPPPVDTVVPEPATLALTGIGLLGVGIVARRRRVVPS